MSQIPITVKIIPNPRPRQASAVNVVIATPGRKSYRLRWRTVVDEGATAHKLTGLDWRDGGMETADSVEVFTTYAECQARASALGITNLPSDPAAST